ncbi:hypothetical protein EDC04DRAFT_2599357 [Pisolithus marmoratus]|nr:hypothetical protein EDC04DRAFT_2599357 [Pisolithus marmoratus]
MISMFMLPIPLLTPLQPLQPPHVPLLPPHVPLPPHTSHTRWYGIIMFRLPGNLETILVHGRTHNIGEHKGTGHSKCISTPSLIIMAHHLTSDRKISPPNDTTVRLAKGLAEAHKHNMFNLRLLEYELLEKFHSTGMFTLEWSHAIKCLTIPLQLAGGKKFQEVLSCPGIMEQFMSDADAQDIDANVKDLCRMWMLMCSLVNLSPPVTDDTHACSGRNNVRCFP